jgi:hypothetical protein
LILKTLILIKVENGDKQIHYEGYGVLEHGVWQVITPFVPFLLGHRCMASSPNNCVVCFFIVYFVVCIFWGYFVFGFLCRFEVHWFKVVKWSVVAKLVLVGGLS